MRKGRKLVPLDCSPFRRMKQFSLYISILFLSFSYFAQEEESFYFQFTAEDGLPSNRIYDFIQDGKGYL
ncbi:MAG: ligand-binding sensor domain-containing protein [Maribacter sp.]|jgi:ligand-binding sensor domain-containing protein